jgi:hypothetical protein
MVVPHLPESPAEGPRKWHIRIDQWKTCGVGDLRNDTFDDPNVAVESPVETPTTDPSTLERIEDIDMES